jgi:predicted unusual protein kinase regulating ubiquinone biosynthesis (AarF/ABC1/UbiB family)
MGMAQNNQHDKNTATKRIGRYARVGTAMSGLAVKVAGERFFGKSIDRDDHAKQLKDILGNLRGPLLKIAQLLATIPEALPPEYTRELQHLQANAPPMGWPFVKRRMAAELGTDWQSKFKEFPRDAAAAASLGQVHKAILPDGTIAACKLQYPDMESAVQADVQQLKMLLGLYERYDPAIQTKFVVQEITDRLHEELDYVREAKQCRLYANILRDEPSVSVPQVLDAWCGARLLTTTWLDGAPILSFKDAPQDVRNDIALNLFRAWYIPFYHYGIIHGDPHLGNYTVRDDHGINLLDFGCIRVFPPRFVKGVVDLYQALLKNDDDMAVHAYEQWGFKNLDRELIDVLNIWARFLYGPIMDDRVRTIGRAEGAVFGKETAQKVHQLLREKGGVSVPREFVFMDRAALGLGSVFIHLQAEINWYQVFQQLIQDIDVNQMQKRQDDALKQVGL